MNKPFKMRGTPFQRNFGIGITESPDTETPFNDNMSDFSHVGKVQHRDDGTHAGEPKAAPIKDNPYASQKGGLKTDGELKILYDQHVKAEHPHSPVPMKDKSPLNQIDLKTGITDLLSNLSTIGKINRIELENLGNKIKEKTGKFKENAKSFIKTNKEGVRDNVRKLGGAEEGMNEEELRKAGQKGWGQIAKKSLAAGMRTLPGGYDAFQSSTKDEEEGADTKEAYEAFEEYIDSLSEEERESMPKEVQDIFKLDLDNPNVEIEIED